MKCFGLPDAVKLLLIAVVASLGACRATGADEAGIGLAIAAHLEALGRLPTAVLDAYQCQPLEEPCRDGPDSRDMSLVDASSLVTAFAEPWQIPVLHYGDAPTPRCAWAAEASEPTGLLARFIRPPQIEGDSARVLLATSCVYSISTSRGSSRPPAAPSMSPPGIAAHQEVHEFILHRRRGQWRVKDVLLVSQT